MKRLCCFLALSLITGAIGWVVPLEAAQDGDAVIHLVQPGENLFRISLRYGVTMDSIMAANGLTDSHTIFAGQQLVIPVASDVVATAGGQPTVTGNVYTVRAGDTLTSVALSHGVTIWMLVQANELSNPHIIYVGQELVIPAYETAAVAQDGATPDPNETAAGEVPGELVGTYTVRPGDTLYRIAQQFGTTVAQLAYLNGIANPSTIYAGQVLHLAGEAPTAALGTKWIVVDLSEQHLYAYQGEQLLYSFVASSGAAPTYTRTGEFRVQSKIPNAYGASWNIWMPHWLGIYWAGGSENGIHALPILPSGQTLWAGYLGTPISYGCIVLGTYEAKLLYDWAEIGTPVTIEP
jgi:LysM repeat protein